ncbi:MAG: septum formation inhibitor Maf [Hyphomonadaceae bacterium]|nr:septum formation inhibitor Maf [Clostridia bacterium]
MEFVLASQSPRRLEILARVGLCFEVIPSTVEEVMDERLSPCDLVQALALQKAMDVVARVAQEKIVIAADTVVVLDGLVLGKPVDENDAFAMLSSLSGRSHTVYTGFACVQGNVEVASFEQTDVTFRTLTHDEIWAYIRSGEPMDKAGAYGVQGLGMLLVERINGDFFNVMGLPMQKLACVLKEHFNYSVL